MTERVKVAVGVASTKKTTRQALGKPPSAKYESNQTGISGPTLKDLFDVTRRHMPPTDVVRLLDMAVFNVLACNTDAHAKNYSIIIRAAGSTLAPLYDVMCGEVWEKRDEEPGAENCRQEPGRPPQGETLAAVCPRLRAKSQASY